MYRPKLSVTLIVIATTLSISIRVTESYRQAAAKQNPVASRVYMSRKAAHNLNEPKPTRTPRRSKKKAPKVTESSLGKDDISQESLTSGPISQDVINGGSNVTVNQGQHSDLSLLTTDSSNISDTVRCDLNDIVDVDVPMDERAVPERRPSIHERLLEGRGFQLHIPPIANFKPVMRKAFTRPDTYAQLSVDGSQNAEAEGEGDYVDGPLCLYDMVKQGQIPDFRHSVEGTNLNPGESEMFTWRLERPPDVFIINWSGVAHVGYRDGVIIAARALLTITQDQPREIRDILQMIAEEGKLPIWLSTRSRYAQPFIDKAADWIPALYFFINNCNDQDILAQDHRIQALADTKARPIDIIKHITNRGDPNSLIDMGKQQRDDMAIGPFEMSDWKTDNSRYSTMESTYDQILKRLEVDEENLERIYQSALDQLYEDQNAWLDAVLYRTKCDHLDDTQRQNHEAFNCAVVSTIKHHLEVFELPVYLVSDVKTTSMIHRELEALGIRLKDIRHLRGRECGSVEENVHELLRELDLDHRVPVHYFDDRLRHLENVTNYEGLDHVRTYFVDWGRSTFNEKLGALYSDRWVDLPCKTNYLQYEIC
ncbi:hypothetical protein X943_002335 [Babesia divergens]|uniref:Uncharacterized protein n=1 Tax=Babesia divergens TaxID=32595 RepID=A0AAD9GLB5_BABDI|nr:hypothetical protein X943_002335 [Babesia divergens]